MQLTAQAGFSLNLSGFGVEGLVGPFRMWDREQTVGVFNMLHDFFGGFRRDGSKCEQDFDSIFQQCVSEFDILGHREFSVFRT